MANICDTCGLPEELCVCEDVEKEQSHIIVTNEERSYNKEVTIVDNIPEGIDLGDLSTKLKKQLACGGTVREEKRLIELQGDHRNRIGDILEEEGFEVNM